jgi:hypothetical protein
MKRNAGNNVHRARPPRDGAAGVLAETNTFLALPFSDLSTEQNDWHTPHCCFTSNLGENRG